MNHLKLSIDGWFDTRKNVLAAHDLVNMDKIERIYSNVPRSDLIQYIPANPKLVIDVGCNTGATGEKIKQLWPLVRMIGVETHPESAAIAKTRMDDVIGNYVEKIDWAAYGISEGSVDAIILGDVLEHIYNPWQALQSLKPLLSSGGKIIASIPNIRNLMIQHEIARGEWSYCPDGLLDVTHIRFFSRKEIVRQFTGIGFTIDSIIIRPDRRLEPLQKLDEFPATLQTERLILPNLSQADLLEIRALQFIVIAS
jgi:SAM-dependent methyltransferase